MAEKHITAMKAIRLKCLDCCLNQVNEVRLCTAKDCPLWELRFGFYPWRKGQKKSAEGECAKDSEGDSVLDGETLAEDI